MTDSQPKRDNALRIAWFKSKQYTQLFDEPGLAEEALDTFGFVRNESSLRSGQLTAKNILLVFFLVLVVSLLYGIVVSPKDKCYELRNGNIEIQSELGIKLGYAVKFGKAMMCPAEASKTWLSWLPPEWPQLISNFGIILTLAFGYLQWKTTRSHASLSEAFTRKLTSNQMIMDKHKELGHFIGAAQTGSTEIKPELAPASGGPAADTAPQAAGNGQPTTALEGTVIPDTFIYMEMDNLEYVYEKYRDGDISARSALRACFIFASRCGDAEFRRKAPDFAAFGFYRPQFKDTVEIIAKFAAEGELDRMMKESKARRV